MATKTIRKPASFRLRADLLERLRRNAVRENRTLNNYVESVLLDYIFNEPNETTKAAIREAMSGAKQNMQNTGEIWKDFDPVSPENAEDDVLCHAGCTDVRRMCSSDGR